MQKPQLLLAVALCAMLCYSPVASAKTRRELQPTIRKSITVQKRLRASRRAAALAARMQRLRAANPVVASAIGKPKRVSMSPDIAVTRPTVTYPTVTLPVTPALPDAAVPTPVAPPAPKRTRIVTAPGHPVQSDSTQLEVLRLVNAERSKAGLQTLRMDGLLQESAQRYADDMHKRDFFGHRDPDGNSSLDRIRAVGFLNAPCDCPWTYSTGENLARGQSTPKEVVDAWMDSPSHRDNILHAAYTDIGVGYRNGYWVQHFGTLKMEVTE